MTPHAAHRVLHQRVPRLRARFAAVVALAATLGCGAASAGDLIEIQRLAREHDSQLAAARAAWQASRESLPQARALLLPSITGTASANHNETDSRLSGAVNPFLQSGRRSFTTSGVGVQLTQPLYRRAASVQVDQAGIQLTQGDLQLMIAEQELTLRAAQAYFDVLGAQAALAVIEAQKAAIAEQLAQAKANFELGAATIVDFNEARSRADVANAQEIVARNDLEIRRQALQQIIGSYPPPLRPLKEPVPLSMPVPAEMDRWVQQSQVDALPVRLQQAAVELAGREIERQRAGHQPTLDAVGSAGHNYASASATSSLGTRITQYVIGLQVNVPLYSGGGTTSRVREAIANRERALQEIESTRRAAALATRQAYLGVTSGINQVAALEAALESTRISLESTQLGLKVGVRTQVDVLNAQQAFFTAQRDLALARHATLLAGLRLRAAIGDLQDEDLEPINALLR